MLLTTVSLVPVALALALALGLFGAWVAFMIRADRRLLADATAHAATEPSPGPARPLPTAPAAPVAPVVAIVTPEPTPHRRPHYLVPAPDPGPEPVPDRAPAVAIAAEPAPCPVVRSGSFCTVVGASGVTASGTEMVCSSDNGARPRWRRATRQLQRTA